jgi:S-adenosylmethionine-dependent methyltransferase
MSRPQRYSGDRNFDDLIDRFKDRIYNTRKGQIRSAVLISELENWFPRSSPPCTLLDAGGGFGPISHLYAEHGHTVHLCDISSKMLKCALNQPNANTVHHHQSIQNLKIAPVDVIFCHAVLEWVEDKAAVVQALMRLLKPNGRLSILFYNVHSLRFKRLLFGEIERLNAPVETGHGKSLTPCYPCDSDSIKIELEKHGFNVESETGVRCISDFLPRNELETLDLEKLIEAEKTLSSQSPYRELARYVHIKGRKQ